jgi:uncharacterized damage-inducible protein DinB
MDKQTLLGAREYFNLVHGVTLRAIGTFADEDLDFRPRPEARSVRELILHIYGIEKVLAEGARDGRLTAEAENAALPEKEEAAPILSSLFSVKKAQEFARNCRQAADAALNAMSDSDLSRIVESPFGSFPGWQFFTFAYDEHWHHRGQLYTYLRLLGKEPPMLYDYQPSAA